MPQKDERSDLVGYLLPRTVVGLALWLLIFALGASISGVVFFVAYERRLVDLQNQLGATRSELEQRLGDAITQLQNADKAIENGVSGTVGAGPVGAATALLTQDAPSVVTVQGTDMYGNRTSGSGFVLNSTATQSWVLTSYQLVAGTIAAANGGPAPPPGVTGTATPSGAPSTGPPPSPVATVHIAGADHNGTVYSWDAARNLALIVVSVGKVPSLQFSNVVPTQGLNVWAIAASGGPTGATAASGRVTTANSARVSTDAAVGMPATGGPLVDQEGKVIGVVAIPLPTPSPTPNPSPSPSPAPKPNGTAKAPSPSPSPSPSPAPVAPALTPAPAIPVRLACIQVVVCPRS